MARTFTAALLLRVLTACGGGTDPGDAPGADGAARLLVVQDDGGHSGEGQLHVTDVLGRTPRQFGASMALVGPVLSPDGRRIVFTDREPFGPPINTVWVVNVDGSGRTQLTPSGHGAGTPSWSPDGTRLAFTYDAGTPTAHDYGLYVMSADGSGRRLVTTWNVSSGIAWSPDGTHLAFASATPFAALGRNPALIGIAIVPTAGGTPRVLRTPDCGDFSPSWSPDGRRLLLLECATTPSGPQRSIVTVSVDGTAPITIAAPRGVGSPTWSPDGHWIAFMADVLLPAPADAAPTYIPVLHVMPAAGGAARVVAGDPRFAIRSHQWMSAGAATP